MLNSIELTLSLIEALQWAAAAIFLMDDYGNHEVDYFWDEVLNGNPERAAEEHAAEVADNAYQGEIDSYYCETY